VYIHKDGPIDPDCAKRALKACEGEPFFGDHEGKRYCVLHFPGAEKKGAFEIAFERKLASHDSNYQGWFPGGNWFAGLTIETPLDLRHTFFAGRAAFYKTTFNSHVTFEGVIFNEGAWFDHSTFGGKVSFNSAHFRKATDFGHATFSGKVDFVSANFLTRAEFGHARFELHADFRDCVFNGEVDFGYSAFKSGSFWPATFNSTVSFSDASFVRANFRVSEFKAKAIFSFCVFGSAEFIDASFGDAAVFSFSRFEEMANFVRAKFDSAIKLDMCSFDNEARFTLATFNGKTDFSYTVFKDIVSFSAEDEIGGFGKNATCDFRHTRFETPRRVSFHGLTLRPHWFVNLDPREFEFVDVTWIGKLSRHFINIELGELRIRQELERNNAAERRAERLRDLELFGDQVAVEELKKEEVEAARVAAGELKQRNPRFYRLLSIACRQLAINAEENHRYDQGSDFRFWSMELQRKEGWRARGRLTTGISTLFIDI
jgi:uncharacterized protein YjbI with pentapeptide repeats